MSTDKLHAVDSMAAATKYNTTPEDAMVIKGYYHAVCYDADGNVKWEEPIQNLVTTAGQNKTLDTILEPANRLLLMLRLRRVKSLYRLFRSL
mgnify:CR=1 FL=1